MPLYFWMEEKLMTNTIKYENGSTRTVAHRGVSGLECENTNAAFVAAGNRSYFGIETDIWRTADGQFILIHDGDPARVGGDHFGVEGVTFATNRAVRLFDKDGRRRGDLCLPSLDEYVRICKKYGKVGVLELKSVFTEEEIRKLVDIIRAEDYLSGIIFISFHYENLEKVRVVLPESNCQFLTGDNSDALIEKLKSDHIDLDIAHPGLDQERIEAFHRAGIRINCWTVDDPARAEQLAAWGVDYITSNILEGKGEIVEWIQ